MTAEPYYIERRRLPKAALGVAGAAALFGLAVRFLGISSTARISLGVAVSVILAVIALHRLYERGTLTVTAIVATTHTLVGRGGLRLSPEALRAVADALRVERPRMLAHHDETLPLSATIRGVEVTELDDGELGVVVTFDVDKRLWEDVGGSRFGGFSMAFTDPTQTVTLEGPTGGPRVTIAPDAVHFPRALEWLRELSRPWIISYAPLYQLADAPPPKVNLQLDPRGAIAREPRLLPVLARFLLQDPDTPTQFVFHRVAGGGVANRLTVSTQDRDVLAVALDRLPDALQVPGDQVFDVSRRRWSRTGSG